MNKKWLSMVGVLLLVCVSSSAFGQMNYLQYENATIQEESLNAFFKAREVRFTWTYQADKLVPARIWSSGGNTPHFAPEHVITVDKKFEGSCPVLSAENSKQVIIAKDCFDTLQAKLQKQLETEKNVQKLGLSSTWLVRKFHGRKLVDLTAIQPIQDGNELIFQL